MLGSLVSGAQSIFGRVRDFFSSRFGAGSKAPRGGGGAPRSKGGGGGSSGADHS